jgi:Protein of unknown function (DUF3108)
MRLVFSFLILVFCAFNSTTQEVNSNTKKRPYNDGESIKYELHFGPITGGYATGVIKREKFEDKEVFHAYMIAKSSGLADILFSIKDIYESFFDLSTGLPYRSVRNVQEGSYKQYIEVQFDHTKNQLVSSKSGLHKVSPSEHDILSAFYSFRSMNYSGLKEGDLIIFQTFFGDEIFALKIRYRGKDIVKTGLGKISCYRFAPVTEVGRAFATEDEMTIWISDDANHLPIRVKMNLRVGSIKCDLIEFSNLVTELKKLP